MSIRLLEHMRDELIATGIVQNTPEFCHSWLGRSEGYTRVLRYHNTEQMWARSAFVQASLGIMQRDWRQVISKIIKRGVSVWQTLRHFVTGP